MSDYLGQQHAFVVSASPMLEVVLRSGEKIQLLSNARVAVERPNHLRSDRTGPVADLSLYYDGDTLTLYGARRNLYATADAPPRLDAAIDFAREHLDLEAPGADLLYGDVYDTLMEDVVSGMYVGEAVVDGVLCDQLAFRGNETDWQLWIERGARPLPRRYVIVSKHERAQPEFAVDLYDWDLNPRFATGFFDFQPPPGAQQIRFRAARSGARGRSAARLTPRRDEGVNVMETHTKKMCGWLRAMVAAAALALGLTGLAAVGLGPGPRVAHAVIGRPLTPMSYAGVARRTSRRTTRRVAVASTTYVTTLPPGCAMAGGVYRCGVASYRPSYYGTQVVYVPVG